MKETKSGKKRIFIIAGLALVLIACGILIGIFISKRNLGDLEDISDPTIPGGRGTIVANNNADEMQEEYLRPVEDGYFEVRQNMNWIFPGPGQPSSNAYVENSTNNTRTVYIDVILADSHELVYSSPFIPLGAKLENFTLDVELPSGEHAVIVTYNLVDDDHQLITTASVTTTLHIG